MITFVLVTTGACLMTLSSRQPSLPGKELAVVWVHFFQTLEDFSQKPTVRQFVLRSKGRCTGEGHVSVNVVEPEHSKVPCIWIKREEASAGMKVLG